jgi:hypothetical protein
MDELGGDDFKWDNNSTSNLNDDDFENMMKKFQ